MNHTPGPWFIAATQGNLEPDSRMRTSDGVLYRTYGEVCVKGADGYDKKVAFVYLGQPYEDPFEKTYPMIQEQLANSLLISAAPDLLEALRLIADCDPPFHATTEKWGTREWQVARQQHIEVARTAIAKAEAIPEGVKLCL